MKKTHKNIVLKTTCNELSSTEKTQEIINLDNFKNYDGGRRRVRGGGRKGPPYQFFLCNFCKRKN